MSAAKSPLGEDSKNDYRIHGGSWANAWKIAGVVGVIGLAASMAGWSSDPKRFAFSYLFAFLFFLTIGLGAMFFVLAQHMTSSGWGVSVRRTAEFFMSGLPLMIVLFIPVLLCRDNLFPWLHPEAIPRQHTESAVGGVRHTEEHGGPDTRAESAERDGNAAPAAHMSAADEENEAIEHDEQRRLLEGKRPFLNLPFFLVRVLLYFLGWAWVSMRLFGWSTQQDKSKDPQLTVRMQRFSPGAAIIFALTLTFAGFDWLMSLNPYWYSTIFGVWVFAGSVVAIHALITLVTVSFRANGYTGEAINAEHFHDLGKLTFGFLVFWAYITFAQFFLTWYASIPEETVFYHARWGDGPWKNVSIALILVHFVLPFVVLLSRNVKRRVGPLAIGCAIILVMHLVEMYWAVMPNYIPHAGGERGDVLQIHWMDFTSLMAVGGIYLAWVFRQMANHSLIPFGDPRLPRSLAFENA